MVDALDLNIAEIYNDFSDFECDLIVKAWNFMRDKYPDLPVLSRNTVPFANANNVWKTLDKYLEWGDPDHYPAGEQEAGNQISLLIRREMQRLGKRHRERLRVRERL